MNKKKPYIISENKHTLKDLKQLRREQVVFEEQDIYIPQLKELFEITHPDILDTADYKKQCTNFIKERTADQEKRIRGNWIYFPWNGLLVHTLQDNEYLKIRTNRNRNLITESEQETLRNFTVGIVGLSVGSNVATILAYGGMSRNIKLAEFDTLETSNLNRIRARIDQVGLKKIDIAARQLYEVDPYMNVHCYAKGLTRETLAKFVLDKPRPKILFEIIDNFAMKIFLRDLARKERIPVVMVTNLGDRVIMDVERYDLDRTIEYFNGRAGSVPEDILKHPDTTAALQHKYAVSLAGVEHIPKRALDSVDEIGKTLVGRPQLASTVNIAAGFSSYIVRKIALGEPLPSGSWLIDLDKIFIAKIALT